MITHTRHVAFVVLCVAMLSACDQLPQKDPQEKVEAESPKATNSPPGVVEISQALADGNYREAAESAQAAIDASPHDAELFLLLARAQARLHNVGSAVQALQMSFDEGFHDPRGALNNPDFDGIRTNRIFVEFASRFQGKQPVGRQPSRQTVDSSIRAGDVSITEGGDGRVRIRAGDVTIEE